MSLKILLIVAFKSLVQYFFSISTTLTSISFGLHEIFWQKYSILKQPLKISLSRDGNLKASPSLELQKHFRLLNSTSSRLFNLLKTISSTLPSSSFTTISSISLHLIIFIPMSSTNDFAVDDVIKFFNLGHLLTSRNVK